MANSSLFILRQGKVLVYHLVYVDDIVLTDNQPNFLTSLIKQVSQAFELKDLGPLHYFLSLHITRTSTGLFLNQAKYAHDLLVKQNMISSKLAKSPCAPNLRLVPHEGFILANPHEYRSMVGSLQYLIFTQPA